MEIKAKRSPLNIKSEQFFILINFLKASPICPHSALMQTIINGCRSILEIFSLAYLLPLRNLYIQLLANNKHQKAKKS